MPISGGGGAYGWFKCLRIVLGAGARRSDRISHKIGDRKLLSGMTDGWTLVLLLLGLVTKS